MRATGKTEELEKLLVELDSFARFNPASGEFIVTKKRGQRGKRPGSVLGHRHCTGGLMTNLGGKGKYVFVHRLVWLYHYGEWPLGQIDHLNGDKQDNRIENLRVVTSAVNNRNRPKRKDNTSGITGVYWRADCAKWTAQVSLKNRRWVGTFATKEQAIAERQRILALDGEYTERHGK